MMPKAYPTKFEIKTGVNATEWAALADVIGCALRKMELQGDKR